MERPFLGGESSGTGVRRIEPHNRSDAIAFGSPYEKAAALVDLAEDGIGLPEQILEQSNFQNATKFYFMLIRLDFIWFLNYFALIILNFIEKPLWCTNYSTYSCNNRDYFYLGELPYLTGVESLVYEGIALIILVAHTFFPISYEGHHLYWKDPLNRLKSGAAFGILEREVLLSTECTRKISWVVCCGVFGEKETNRALSLRKRRWRTFRIFFFKTLYLWMCTHFDFSVLLWAC